MQKQNTIKSNKINIVLNIFFYLVIAISLIFTCFNIIFHYSMVDGISMQPTINANWDSNLKNGDTAYYSTIIKTAYRTNDIIIAVSPTTNDWVIKRFIADENDKFYMANIDGEYHLFVNDKQIDESYLSNPSVNSNLNNRINLLLDNGTISSDYVLTKQILINEVNISVKEITIPQGYCFYLGDNRLASSDCSVYGFAKKSNIIAKVSFIVPNGTNIFEYFFNKIFG